MLFFKVYFMFKWKRRLQEVKDEQGKKIGSGVQGDVYSNGNEVTKKYTETLGNEFLGFVDEPKMHIVKGEMEAWNGFYKRHDPSFAKARMDTDGNLVMPKIPGVGADDYMSSHQVREGFREDLVLFKQMVKEIMQDVTGKEMRDQKNNDVLVSVLPSGNYRFLQVDFGEFGMYNVVDEALKNTENSSNSPR